MAPRNMPNILDDEIQTVPIDQVKPYPKNPRRGNIGLIAESLKEHGQFRPIIVQKSTGYILGGNHTFYAAQQLKMKTIKAVYVDVDDEHAKKIVLIDNRASDLASYDSEILAEIIASLDTPAVGTGYSSEDVSSLLAAVQERDTEMVEQVIYAAPKVQFDTDDDEDDPDFDDKIEAAKKRVAELHGEDKAEEIIQQAQDPRKVAQAELQLLLEAKEATFYEVRNYWGIPELRKDMLVDSIPQPIDTWAGKDVTPDDGKTTWVYNWGTTSASGMPWDRAILSFFTWDTKFDQWFDEPAFYTAKVFTAGCRQAIVPDTSMWVDYPRYTHLVSMYQAQWLGRFMQEAGMKVMPRIVFTDLESVKYGILGIPKNPPVLAWCSQTLSEDDGVKLGYPDALRAAVKEIQPEAILFYGGPPGRRLLERAKLPKSIEVVCIENFVAKRRGAAFGKKEGAQGVKLDTEETPKRKGRTSASSTKSKTPEEDVEEPIDPFDGE